jgi:hypothetical protein
MKNHTLQQEEWRPVVGYEGLYEVSSTGKARSLPRIIRDSRWGKSTKPGRELSVRRRRGNPAYCVVALYDGNKRKAINVSLHRLVAEHFIPNKNRKPYVNHIDGNPLNNKAVNLEWTTPGENIRHSFSLGRRNPAIGPQNWNTRLEERDIRAIRILNKDLKYSFGRISEMFGVTRTAIDKIIKNKNWKYV